jgi:hypothetical protein
LRARGGEIYHLDMKIAPGVDIVGDLLDSNFLEHVTSLEIRSALISNLLEHVANRQKVCDVINNLVPASGHIFVSGPHRYPYHPDPIDTMFRPTIKEVHALFPQTKIIESAILDSGNWRHWNVAERGRPLGRFIARLLFPFYRPVKWWELLRQSPYILRHITAFAVVLRKL